MSYLVLLVVFFVLIYWFSEMERKERLSNQNRNEEIIANIEDFSPTKCIENYYVDTRVYIDEDNKKVAFAFGMQKSTLSMHTFRFDELLECSVLEDGATVQSGGVGRAVVGGVLAGGVGAIVGATTRKSDAVTRSLSVQIVTSNLNSPLITIPIIITETPHGSLEYKEKMEFTQKIYATITSILYRNQTKS